MKGEKGWRKLRKNTTHFPYGEAAIQSLEPKVYTVYGLLVKVPSTGGLAVLGVGKPVGRKRGGGGHGFSK
jgi:hypothetical protein